MICRMFRLNEGLFESSPLESLWTASSRHAIAVCIEFALFLPKSSHSVLAKISITYQYIILY